MRHGGAAPSRDIARRPHTYTDRGWPAPRAAAPAEPAAARAARPSARHARRPSMLEAARGCCPPRIDTCSHHAAAHARTTIKAPPTSTRPACGHSRGRARRARARPSATDQTNTTPPLSFPPRVDPWMGLKPHPTPGADETRRDAGTPPSFAAGSPPATSCAPAGLRAKKQKAAAPWRGDGRGSLAARVDVAP